MKKLISLFIVSGILFSCNESDDNNEVTNELDGQWNLVSVSCFCEPINLENGEHLWSFDINNSELIVVNNVTEPLHTLLETGTYDITVVNNNVTIQSVEYDYYFENGKLYLADNPESDGPLITFVK
ncbi:MAG: hypothetical protein WA775_07430 [Psychroserpens sp.]|uniref:hypothetical protein n=1 Tax=Psychroserpens sp. TaxID=2020870 RepID=UPI003C77591A